MTFSTKELIALDEQLSAEQVLVKKYTAYSETTTDTALKDKYTCIANKHRDHYNRLLSCLNQ